MIALVYKNLAYIFHTQTQKLLNKIDIGNEIILLAEFDPSSKYLIIRTSKGRILQYIYNSPALFSRLYSFTNDSNTSFLRNKNFINTFAFYKEKIAYSGYRGTVFIANLKPKSDTKTITCGQQHIRLLYFLDKSTLLAIDTVGCINILSLQNMSLHKKIPTPFKKIQKILPTQNPNYLIISSQKGIALFDTKEYTLRKIKYPKKYYNDLKKLKLFISQNQLKEAFELIFHNEILNGSMQHKKIEKMYTNRYLKALDALIKGKEELALRILNDFKDVKQKEQETHLLFEDFKHYDRFKIYYSQNNLPLAYAIAEKYPNLKHTPQYKKMQTQYIKTVYKAQKQLLNKNIKKSESYLSKYISITSKQQSIKYLLTKNKNFIKLLKAIKHKDYKTIHHLTKTNSSFMDTLTYQLFKKEIQADIKKIKIYLKKEDISSAKKYLSKVKGYQDEELNRLSIKYKHISSLQERYKNNDFIKCYELMDKHEHLTSTELGKFLEKHYSKLIQKCELYATHGEINKVKTTLNELINISSRKTALGNLFRFAFYNKISKLISTNKPKQAENTIYSYADIFALDKEIKNFMKKYEIKFDKKIAITYKHGGEQTRDSWIDSPFMKL